MGRRRAPPRVRANRLNAKKSSGPKTEAGKQRSAGNAILHGFSAKTREVSSDPDIDRFAELLCEGDERSEVIEAAREVAEAQFELNMVRQYKLILRVLKAKGRSVPLPGSELLDDPSVMEFLDFMATGEPADYGVAVKADHRLHRRIINFIFRQARRSKDPDVELLKLDRYEWMALRRRLAAIEKLDTLRGEPCDETSLPYSPSAQPRSLSGPRGSALRVHNRFSGEICKTNPLSFI